jgi:hypothetical protein
MKAAPLLDLDEDRVKVQTPHLSHSRVSKYLHCPEQYRLYYVENLRTRSPASSLVFGQVIHAALADLFGKGGDPVSFFETLWAEAKDWDLTYKNREPWEKLRDSGQGLLEKFLKDDLPRLGDIQSSEESFRFQVTGIDEPFVGIIDLVAALEGVRTLIDFKTSAGSYEPHEVLLSDQLTAYQLAKPDAAQAALCVLVKTKEPKIEWHVARRVPDQLTEYLGKVGYVAREIASGRFYKRPGKWCSWCDFLPVCTGDTKTAQATLVSSR